MSAGFIKRLVFLNILIYPIGICVAQPRPNIVLIMADNLDDYATPQFFPEVLPVVDSLYKAGIVFRNSFTPLSVCCPSRAATLSGKYGHKTNVMNNGSKTGGWAQFKDDERYALPAYLQRAGYNTTMIGKYLNGYEIRKGKLPPSPYGWTDGDVFVGKKSDPYVGYDYALMEWRDGKAVNDSVWESKQQLRNYGDVPEDYSTDVVAHYAVDFIKRNESDDAAPLFLYLNSTAPHFPLYAPPRHYKRTLERWGNSPAPSQPNTFNDNGVMAFGDEQISKDKPWWIRQTWKKRIRQSKIGGQLFNLLWQTKVPGHIRIYKDADWFNRMGSLYALNDMIVRVINALKEYGEWDNTLLIFTSDNGYQFGNHGLYQKSTPYEESIRVPMVIGGGAALNLRKNESHEHWVTNLDLMPTILDLAGVARPEGLDGESLATLIQQDKKIPNEWRDRILLEYDGPGMAGFLDNMKRYMIKWTPSWFSDLPTYRAIRMKTQGEDGSEQVFKYIEWERYPWKQHVRDKISSGESRLSVKIEKGRTPALKKAEKAQRVEKELYNLSDDPYEMDNLLYYQHDKYSELAGRLKEEMRLLQRR